ncbi:MAG: aminotransferase class IV, partial [Caldilineaceae bacterium]|nr:aminotransferase class IV [Caldilineaceae bacterium]
MAQPIFYVNGELVTSDRAALPLNDLGIVRGYGVFDYWRTYNYVHFHMDDHLRRLQRSADQIDLALPCDLDELAARIEMTYAANDYANAGIRVVVTGGASTDFMTPQGNPSLVIMVTPLPEYNEQLYTKGVKTVTSEMVRERPTVKS